MLDSVSQQREVVAHYDAIMLCRLIEAFCPEYGCHVALTGGCLYKDGERKDVDILFYRIRQKPAIDREGLTKALEAAGVQFIAKFGWMQKARWKGLPVDIFFPEHLDSTDDRYITAEEEASNV